jgi:acyl-CoA hydrolase
MDALEFYAPIRVGDMLTLRGALTRGRTRSMEVEIQVLAEAPLSGEIRHTCTAYLTFVKLRGAWGPLPPLAPTSAIEQREQEAADKRQAARVARVHALKECLEREPAW